MTLPLFVNISYPVWIHTCEFHVNLSWSPSLPLHSWKGLHSWLASTPSPLSSSPHFLQSFLTTSTLLSIHHSGLYPISITFIGTSFLPNNWAILETSYDFNSLTLNIRNEPYRHYFPSPLLFQKFFQLSTWACGTLVSQSETDPVPHTPAQPHLKAES